MSSTRAPLARSLADDLAALDHLDRGDTTAAIAAWQSGLSRYSVEHVVFGLVASLWPLRLSAARVAAASGDQVDVREATDAFEQMAGFTDQVAWPEILPFRIRALCATRGPNPADALRELLIGLLSEANGEAVALRDSLNATPNTNCGVAQAPSR